MQGEKKIISFLKRTDWKVWSLFLVISAVYWVMLHSGESGENEAVLYVRYTDEEGNIFPPGLFTDTVKLRFRGGLDAWHSDTVLMPAGVWSSGDKERRIREFLSRHYDVSLRHVPLEIHSSSSKMALKEVKVQPAVRWVPVPGYALVSEEIHPGKVWIYGKKTRVEAVKSIKTSEKEVKALEKDTLMNIPLEYPRGISGIKKKVKVRAKILPYVSATEIVPLSIPPSLKSYVFFPGKVKVSYKTFLNTGLRERPENWKVVPRKRDTVFVPQVVKKPAGVFDIKIEPQTLDYLIIHER